ncbi:MAG TPA: division/cell wall cluster transcriptional repressor MraZ [Candidatus Binatia bacterium]|nr:division/cell wall cluster transcriptional repressor MraZ [Candidatus Binatia bacterium]
MFRGNHLYSVDDKGRVAIPARFRDELSGLQDSRLVVTRFKRRNEPCLDVYPMAAWQRFEVRLAGERRFSGKTGIFESWYVGAAQDVQVDTQGRMLIPPTLRDFARIGREVMFVGATEKFRIWDRETFEKVDREDEHDLFADPDFLDKLGL